MADVGTIEVSRSKLFIKYRWYVYKSNRNLVAVCFWVERQSEHDSNKLNKRIHLVHERTKWIIHFLADYEVIAIYVKGRLFLYLYICTFNKRPWDRVYPVFLMNRLCEWFTTSQERHLLTCRRSHWMNQWTDPKESFKKWLKLWFCLRFETTWGKANDDGIFIPF